MEAAQLYELLDICVDATDWLTGVMFVRAVEWMYSLFSVEWMKNAKSFDIYSIMCNTSIEYNEFNLFIYWKKNK